MKYLFTLICFSRMFTGFSQDWKTYSNDSILFTAKYPADWVNKIKEGKRVFFTSPLENDTDNFRENINVSVTSNEDYGTKYKIKDMIPGILEELNKVVSEMDVELRRDFKWNNADAIELIYAGYSKSELTRKLRITQWFCFARQRLYVATYTALAENTTYTETARKILNSIGFKQ